MKYWVVFLAFVFFLLRIFREQFTDPEECKTTGVTRGAACVPKITRPSTEDSRWRSKVEAEMPIGQDDGDYIRVLQAFYDKVYVPSADRPTEAQVDAFLASPDASVAGTSPVAMKKIILSGFNLTAGGTAAAREEKQAVTTGALAGFQGKELEPQMGVDEVRTRKEIPYIPVDTRDGPLPEGIYADTRQTTPSRPGDWDDKSISWNRSQFFSVNPTAKNIL
jgi:hypothetical protein